MSSPGDLINVVPVFSGEVASISRKGNSISAKVQLGSRIGETQLPILIRGTKCPHLTGSPGDGSHLISQGCTGPDSVMLKANWKFSAKMSSPDPLNPFTIQLNTLAGVGAAAIAALSAGAVFANWFSSGRIEIIQTSGSDSPDLNQVQRRLIIGSTAPIAGNMVLTIHRPFSGTIHGDDSTWHTNLVIYPGCDGFYSTCKAYNQTANPTGKFGNDLNFGGDPLTPIANPSVSGQQNLGSQGAKK